MKPNALLEEFIFDAREHLGNAGTQLLELEKEPNSLANLNALMGTLHTIKGTSGFFDLPNFYEVFHQSENLLQTVRELKPLVCPTQVIDQLFQVLDTGEAILRRLESGENDRVEWHETLKQALDEVEKSIDSQSAAASKGPDSGQPETPGAPLKPDAAPNRPVQIKKAVQTGTTLADKIETIAIADGDLADNGPGLVEKIIQLRSLALKGLALDLREINSFASQELSTLLSLHKIMNGHLVIIVDQEKQAALYRVFLVLCLNRVFQLVPDEAAADEALNKTE